MIRIRLLYNILIIFILIFLFLEFAYPKIFANDVRVYRYWGDRPVTFFPNSNLRAVTQNYDNKFKTNSLGFNDSEIKKNIDILILGDSFVEAVQVNRNNHFSEILKKNIEDLSIHKMGMSGYGNAQFFFNYMYFYEKYNPKIVIIINASNDVTDNFCDKNNKNCSKFDDLIKIDSKQKLDEHIKILKINNTNLEYSFLDNKKKKLSFTKIIIRKYISKFQTYYSLKDIKNRIFNRKKIKKEILNQPSLQQIEVHNLFSNNKYVLDYYKQINVLLFKTIVKDHNKKLLFVTINKDLYNSSKPNHTQDMIAKFFEKKGYDHLYLNPVMIKSHKKYQKYPNWKNDNHWNEFGHKIVGLEITNFLKKKKWVD